MKKVLLRNEMIKTVLLLISLFAALIVLNVINSSFLPALENSFILKDLRNRAFRKTDYGRIMNTDFIRKTLSGLNESYHGSIRSEFDISLDVLTWSLEEYSAAPDDEYRDMVMDITENQILNLIDINSKMIELRYSLFRYLLLTLSGGIILQFLFLTFSNIKKIRFMERLDLTERNFYEIQKIREQERKRIASYLHDSILQDLGGILIRPSINDDPEIRKDMEIVISNLRNLTYSTAPLQLHSLGLEESIKEYIGSFQKSSAMTIHFLCSPTGEIHLDEDEELVFFRFFQEGLNNARKHSGTDTVWVKLVESHPYLILTVKDQGRGFIYDREHPEESHLGLPLMEQAVKSIGAEFSVNSAIGEGTFLKMKYNLYQERIDGQK